MKKLFAVLTLTLFICAIASPVIASTEEKPKKKANTEQACDKKESCAKSTSCEKSCAAKCESGKATVQKK